MALEPSRSDPGWTALSVRDGDTLDEHAGGPAEAATGRLVTSDTRFQVSSISKMFVATVVASLVERGEVDWHDTLDRWFPTLPEAGRITLHHLLTHTSGIGHWDTVGDHAEFARMGREARLDLLSRTTLLADPGEGWLYSGPGYWLLAAVAEATTGDHYRALVEGLVLQPCGLAATTVGRPDPGSVDVALGDRGRDTAPELALATVPGTGDLWSTVADLTRFATRLHAGEIVTPATVRAMTDAAVRLDQSAWTTPGATADRYGYGRYLGTVLGESAWFHHGDNPGFRSVLAFLPEQGTALAALSNAADLEIWDLLGDVRV